MQISTNPSHQEVQQLLINTALGDLDSVLHDAFAELSINQQAQVLDALELVLQSHPETLKTALSAIPTDSDTSNTGMEV